MRKRLCSWAKPSSIYNQSTVERMSMSCWLCCSLYKPKLQRFLHYIPIRLYFAAPWQIKLELPPAFPIHTTCRDQGITPMLNNCHFHRATSRKFLAYVWIFISTSGVHRLRAFNNSFSNSFNVASVTGFDNSFNSSFCFSISNVRDSKPIATFELNFQPNFVLNFNLSSDISSILYICIPGSWWASCRFRTNP